MWKIKKKKKNRKVDSQTFSDPVHQFKISWVAVSKEFNQQIEELRFFKSEKQCKERWFNHLSPFLKKQFLNFFRFLFKFNFRKMWTIEEDVQLFSESLENPKKWSHIARKMVFRNSHQIKNRFICVVSKELNMKSQKVRELINENCLLSPIFMVLAKLKQKKEE